tara:strand:- start:35 stop:499 length:465 start_codon:yes stop_codon:yes gene_type:complete
MAAGNGNQTQQDQTEQNQMTQQEVAMDTQDNLQQNDLLSLEPNLQPQPTPQPTPRPPRSMNNVPTPTYMVYGTNELYTGLTVEIGGTLYSTEGGTLEGVPYGQQLIPITSEATQNQRASMTSRQSTTTRQSATVNQTINTPRRSVSSGAGGGGY